MSYARRLWAWIGHVRGLTLAFSKGIRWDLGNLWKIAQSAKNANAIALDQNRQARRIALRTRSRLTTTKVTVEELAALGAESAAAKYGIPVDEVQKLIDIYGPST